MAAVQRTGSQRRRAENRNGYYVQGNTVRKLDVTREIRQEPQRKISNRITVRN